MLCVALVLFYQRLGENWATRRQLLTAVDFAMFWNTFRSQWCRRGARSAHYVSSILSKNEVSREGPYNRKLFLRERHGQYLIDPRLALRVEGEWRPIYDLLVPDRLGSALRDLEFWAGRGLGCECLAAEGHR